MTKKEWLFMQTPKEKAEDLIQKFYKWVANNLVIEYYQEVLKEIEKL